MPRSVPSDISRKPGIKAATGGDSGSQQPPPGSAGRQPGIPARPASPRHIGVFSRAQETSEPGPRGQKVLGMKLGVTCLLWLLLVCLTLPSTCGRVLERSMEIKSKENMTPDIDPSWYTGRGIRPVGRFGRRQTPGGDTERGCAAPHPHPHRARQRLNP